MKILITGIGIVGKSTFRRELVKKIRSLGFNVLHLDADNFKEMRDNMDKDCLKTIPLNFNKDTYYIIEDVHGTLSNAVLSLEDYDLIFYIKTSFISHLIFWFPRMCAWFKRGEFSWDKNNGWKGTGKPYDILNLPGILKEIWNDMKNRNKWIRDDLEVLRNRPHVIVESTCSILDTKPRFSIKL